MLDRKLLFALLASASLVPAVAHPQPCTETVEITVHGIGGLDDELLRVGDMVGVTPNRTSRLIRRGGPRREVVCASAPTTTPFERFDAELATTDRTVEAGALPLRLGTVWNSRYPSGENDGLLWAGRGVSQILSGGGTFRAGMVSLALAPEVAWSENQAFPIRQPVADDGTPYTGRQRFANPFYPIQIDLPQRFGAGPFATWSPGQSSLRLERWNAAVGVSSENLWLGPGIRSSILMTNNAPGFPHVFVGTARPVDVWIGDVELLVFWGRLERSRYAYVDNHPLIEGLAFTYTPVWAPGLHLGFARTMLQRWKDLPFRDYLAIFQSPAKKDLRGWYGNQEGDNPFDNQQLSLFFRWVFPESGAEVYGEWAREDHEADIYGILHDPDHSEAWQVGLDKVFRTSTGLLRVYAEINHLQNLRPRNMRGNPVYYIHGNGLDFTNGGQVLGSGLGPGGSSQTLAFDHYHRGGRIGGYLERIVRNDLWYWENVESPTRAGDRDVEVLLGVRQVLAVGPVELAWDAAAGRRWKRDFIKDEANIRLGLELRVPFGGGSRPRSL